MDLKNGSNALKKNGFQSKSSSKCFHQQQQQQQEAGFFPGISKFTLLVSTAMACSFIYILALVLTSYGNLHICRSTTSSSSSSLSYICRPGSSGCVSKSSSSRSLLNSTMLELKNPNSSSSSSSAPNQSAQSEAAQLKIASQALSAGQKIDETGTSLENIVFGIAASSGLWESRKEYVKLWWVPGKMRGFVWMDKQVGKWSSSYPQLKVSSAISKFNYTNKVGSRAAIRISRIVSETFRQGLPDVHWFVMGDDDTVFVPENLVRILSKYDHRKFYYVGHSSESHTQNLHISYNMAYGGGGFAISYPLAKALEKMQDGCLHRYPYLFGSDDRIHACMAELGVPLTKEPGFHQLDIHGDSSGLLAAHPVTPLVTLHHLDVINPVFPNMTQVKALRHLSRSIRVDAGGILQQSICYDKYRKWSFSVSWGYAVEVYRGILPPRELELPARTFLSWYRKTEDSGFPFGTRPMPGNPCEQPTIFYMNSVSSRDPSTSVSLYVRETKRRGNCRWRMASPAGLDWIRVIKERTDRDWHQAPRRQCCRVVNSKKRRVEIEVGACRFGEYIA